MFTNWFVLALVGVITLAASEVLQKKALTTKENINTETNNLIVWIVQCLLSVVFVLIFSIKWNLELTPLLIGELLVQGVLYFFAGTLYYTSYKGQSISLSVIILNLSFIISTVLGIVFFAEQITLAKLLGMVFILAGIVVINYTRKEKVDKYVIYAVIGSAIYGIAFTLDKAFSVSMDPNIYQVMFTSSIIIATFAFRGKMVIKDLKAIKLKNILLALIPGVTFFIFNKADLVAYSVGGEVGKIQAINSTSLFVIILIELLLLMDRKGVAKKLLVSVMVITGVVLLSLNS